jgi:alpha-amylase/alpha-mannosidase (GH57 family)
MKERYICIHGHFYQPPRENPWLEEVELQDSAYPYHDWNERITEECYAPNTASRILDKKGRIIEIINNYSRISFNFGPTLLSWMEKKRPDIYDAVIEADRLSMERFSGHGSAIAQVYNHMIMPLANMRDKETQVKWGIADFKKRFGRYPEGMWLPETAVDKETLEVLIGQGIKFTILAPGQARKTKRSTDSHWTDVEGARVDPTMTYVFYHPSGEMISIFFYEETISKDVAFKGLLKD